MPRYLPAALLLVLPAALAAQDVSGTISGTLDQDPATWTILREPDLPASDWSETDDGVAVEIHAYPDATPPSRDDALELRFTAEGTVTEATPQDVTVTWRQAGSDPLIASGENVDLELNSFEIQGDRLVLAGDLFATMTPGGTEGLVVSGEDDRVFDGNFQATIIRTP